VSEIDRHTEKVAGKPGILKMVKEDILRLLSERKGKVSLNSVKEEIRVIYSCIPKAIEDLEKERLIQYEQGFLELTDEGRIKAKDVLRKHLVFENYFKQSRSEKEAHEIAHILEHYVSREVIDKIIKLSTFKKEGIPLTEVKQYQKGLVTDIMISDDTVFERLVSMGVLPGENIMLLSELPHTAIVEIKNKKFALDKDIAKKIKVLLHEES